METQTLSLRRLLAVYAFGVLLLLATFLFWHSGGRADSLCLRERFVSSGSLSWWPPGARCTYGLPSTHDTLFNFWFVPAGLVVGMVTAALVSVAYRR